MKRKIVEEVSEKSSEDQECEETYVVLEIPSELATIEDIQALSSKSFDIESFNRPSPVNITIGDQILQGEFKPLLGSQLVLSRNQNETKSWNLKRVANKRIVTVAKSTIS
mmetsp:Transcript_21772/g.25745  ORF Transcript_21772/g.25745 Transcript_21772/m.25745 type:complete len:110 (+) Transcript_21772:44-373(+)